MKNDGMKKFIMNYSSLQLLSFCCVAPWLATRFEGEFNGWKVPMVQSILFKRFCLYPEGPFCL